MLSNDNVLKIIDPGLAEQLPEGAYGLPWQRFDPVATASPFYPPFAQPERPLLSISELHALDTASATADVIVLPRATIGKVRYMAPEMIMPMLYEGRRVDAWSVGMMAFVFLFGLVDHPYCFYKNNDSVIYEPYRQKFLSDGAAGYVQTLATTKGIVLSCEAVDFLDFALKADWRYRPDINELLRHPWVARNPALAAPAAA
jgi:serine/threonine protein kinase